MAGLIKTLVSEMVKRREAEERTVAALESVRGTTSGIHFLLFSFPFLIQSTVYPSPLSYCFIVYLCLTGSDYIVAA